MAEQRAANTIRQDLLALLDARLRPRLELRLLVLSGADAAWLQRDARRIPDLTDAERRLLDELSAAEFEATSDGADPISRLTRLAGLGGRATPLDDPDDRPRGPAVSAATPARSHAELSLLKSASTQPLRDCILDVLDLVGVPTMPRLLSALCTTIYEREAPPTRFGSLRRDDERAYRRAAHSRPAWIAPALDATTLAPMPRWIVNSSWAPERRVIGAHSLRANQLRSAFAILETTKPEALSAAEQDQVREVLKLVPVRVLMGARVLTPAEMPMEHARAMVAHELSRVEHDDEEERRDAAARLAALPADQQIWGIPASPAARSAGTGGHARRGGGDA